MAGDQYNTRKVLSILQKLAIDGHLANKTLVDYGTGSGLLGIAALLMGAAEVVATDTDAQAVLEASTNAELNGFTHDKFQVPSASEEMVCMFGVQCGDSSCAQPFPAGMDGILHGLALWGMPGT